MFTLSKFEWLALAAALALCPGWSWGAEPAQSLFERLDRNQDGVLTPDQLASERRRRRNPETRAGIVVGTILFA